MRDYKFGNYIYNLRKGKGLSQKELASILNVTDKAISKWENGSSLPSTIKLKELANYFNITVDSLLLMEEEGNKTIYKIVLTGGPCAGKTTAMSFINEYFSKKGYGIIFIPETAAEILSSGLNPNICGLEEFQKGIMMLQLEKEKIYYEMAKKLDNDKILIIYDRGILDGLAYMEEDTFDKILRETNNNIINLRDNYDAVFHLTTAAKGAKKAYTLESNKVRTEPIDEARLIDDKIINVWTGHPHFRIIKNRDNFEDKMKDLIKEISSFLGEPEPYEIERKYLIEYPDIEKIKKLTNTKKVSIVQTYLKSNKNEEIRIRQRGDNNNFTYSKTKKININGIKRIEYEERLTEGDYVKELVNADPTKRPIIKDRYSFIYNDKYFELDIYPDWSDKAILEIELLSEDEEIILPEWIKVIKEVTNLEEYKNYNLASIN